MIELTLEQAQAIEKASPEPLIVRDPRTNAFYVLLSRETYERIRAVFDDGSLDSHQVAALIEKNMQEYDQDDPLLESYQKYRP